MPLAEPHHGAGSSWQSGHVRVQFHQCDRTCWASISRSRGHRHAIATAEHQHGTARRTEACRRPVVRTRKLPR